LLFCRKFRVRDFLRKKLANSYRKYNEDIFKVNSYNSYIFAAQSTPTLPGIDAPEYSYPTWRSPEYSLPTWNRDCPGKLLPYLEGTAPEYSYPTWKREYS